MKGFPDLLGPITFILIMKSLRITLAILFALSPAALFAATGDTSTGSTVASTLHEELNVKGAPTVVSQTSTSVTLAWAKVDAADSYIVKYGKTSVAEAFAQGKTSVTYDVETDPVSSTGTTISNLKTDTTYYFSVVALNVTKDESPTNSEELAVKLVSAPVATGAVAPTASGAAVSTVTATGSAPAVSTFKLVSVTVTNAKNLVAEFNAPVGTATPVSFNVMKTLDNSAVSVVQSAVDPKDPKKVKVTVAEDMSPASSYSLTVREAKDEQGNSIVEGINAVKEFVTSANLAPSSPAPALNAAPAATGAVAPTASGAVAQASALPATGTQENLILFLAALLSLAIVLIVRKRNA